jgi:hypothetical protein
MAAGFSSLMQFRLGQTTTTCKINNTEISLVMPHGGLVPLFYLYKGYLRTTRNLKYK